MQVYNEDEEIEGDSDDAHDDTYQDKDIEENFNE